MRTPSKVIDAIRYIEMNCLPNNEYGIISEKASSRELYVTAIDRQLPPHIVIISDIDYADDVPEANLQMTNIYGELLSFYYL